MVIENKGSSVFIRCDIHDFYKLTDAVTRKNPQIDPFLLHGKYENGGIELTAIKCGKILEAQKDQVNDMKQFYTNNNVSRNYHILEHKGDNPVLSFMINEAKDLGKSLTGKGKTREQQHQNIQLLIDYYKKNPPQNAEQGLEAAKTTIAYLDSIRQQIGKETNVFSSSTKQLCNNYINELIKIHPEADAVLKNKTEMDSARKSSEEIIAAAKVTAKDKDTHTSKKHM